MPLYGLLETAGFAYWNAPLWIAKHSAGNRWKVLRIGIVLGLEVQTNNVFCGGGGHRWK